MSHKLINQMNIRKTSSHRYAVDLHPDFALGPFIFGGCIAGVLHLAAATHFATTPAIRDQPDVLTLHVEFLRAVELRDDTAIAVTDLKIGAGTSTIQLSLVQGGDDDGGDEDRDRDGKPRAIALATSINFDRPVGPTAAPGVAAADHPLAQRQHHPGQQSRPRHPDFDAMLAEDGYRDPHWAAMRMTGDLMGIMHRLQNLFPRGGYPGPAVYEAWNAWMYRDCEDGTNAVKRLASSSSSSSSSALADTKRSGEGGRGGEQDEGGDREEEEDRTTATHLAVLADCAASMSDMMMGTEGSQYNAHVMCSELEREFDDPTANPDARPVFLEQSLATAMRAAHFHNTVSMDLEFKRRLPADGIRWTYMRAAVRALEGGRMDLGATICDEDMRILCLVKHVILVLDAKRRLGKKGKKGKGEKASL